jgi:toxin YoeB
MGKYSLVTSDLAKAHLAALYKTGDAKLIKKISKISRELANRPRTGTGKPERLKGNLKGYWSRHLSHKHRIVYEIIDSTVTVYIIAAKGHYDDK